MQREKGHTFFWLRRHSSQACLTRGRFEPPRSARFVVVVDDDRDEVRVDADVDR